MILLDPDLEPDPAKQKSAAAPLAARRARAPWRERIPSKQTLKLYLAEAQNAVRLKGEVTVFLTTDRTVRRLNRQFRGKDKATDVLSFPALEAASRRVSGSASRRIVGDLAIGVETARKQAARQGHALTCELKVLILHGLLHLAGYDHENDAGQMARRERALRARLGLPLGLIERTGASGVRGASSVSGAQKTARSHRA